jgi:phage-related protein
MAGDTRTLRVVIVGNASGAQNAMSDLSNASEQAGQSFEGMGGSLGRLREGLGKLGAVAAGALSVEALSKGFEAGLGRIADKTKLAAQLGLTGDEAKKAGNVAGSLYTSGFGDSFEGAAEITRRVSQDMQINLNSPDFKPLAGKVATIAKTFDQDIGGVTRGVSQLMRTGLAKSSSDALDIVAAGFTNGVDKSEDFLDTLNEYGTQFRKLGLDGRVATGLLSQGLKGGARDADLVADSLKEFSIRAVDGSKTTNQGFKSLGLNAKKMATQIGKGGVDASQGLQTTLDKLRAIKDPVKRAQVAVQLFGTQAEDMGKALFSLDPSKAVDGLGKVDGAAKQMADTMGKSAPAQVEKFKRKVTSGLTDGFAALIVQAGNLKTKLGPTFDQLRTKLGPFIDRIRDVASQVEQSFADGKARAAIDQLSQKLSAIWSVVGPALSQLVTFVKTTLIPLFYQLVAQVTPVLKTWFDTIKVQLDAVKLEFQILVGVVKWLWDTFGATILSTARSVFGLLSKIIGGALTVVQGVFNLFIGLFTGDWSRAWQGIKQIFSGSWRVISGAVSAALLAIRTPFRLLGDAIGGIWRLIWSGLLAAFKGGWSLISAEVGKIPGQLKAVFVDLPAQLQQIGVDLIAGLVRGIKNSLPNVLGAAKSIVDQIPGPIRHAMGIHSPSRVMAEIGKFISQGLVVGMLGGSKSVAATAAKLHKLVTQALNAKAISRKKANGIQAYISRENAAITKLSKQREAVASKLTAANAKLASLKSAKADMASSIAGKAKDFGGFLGAYDSSDFADNSASAIIGRLKAKLSAIFKFRQNLYALSKRGLGAGIINELAQAGPEQGGQMAQALLNANGAQIKDLNATYKAIGDQSNALGNQVAGQYYDAGIAATQGLINGLKSQESKLTKAITDMSKDMVKALKKALGIKSPSRVFRAQGVYTGQGFALGVEDTADDVQKAVNGLAATRPTGRLANRSIARETALQGAARGNAAPTVYVTVQGNVTAEKALAKAIAGTVRDEIVRSGKRNGGRTGF